MVNRRCSAGIDCVTGVCSGGVCTSGSCTDGVQNNDETAVDCGGSCGQKCDTGFGCAVNADCTSKVCGPGGSCQAPTCFDGVWNGAEADPDCGAVCAAKCAIDRYCYELRVLQGDRRLVSRARVSLARRCDEASPCSLTDPDRRRRPCFDVP